MFLDSIKQCYRNLKRRKSRTYLTILSIAIGVASVVLTSSVGETGKMIVGQEMEQLGIDGIIIGKESSAQGIDFGETQLETIRKQKNIEEAVPVITSYAQVKMRNYTAKSMVWGIDQGAKQVISLNPIYGRMIHKSDVIERENVCLVDVKTANAFYHRDNIVGKTLQILVNGTYHEFKVVGVVSTGGDLLQGIAGSYMPTFVYIPYTTMQEITGKQSFNQIAVKVSPDSSLESMGEEILKNLSAVSGQSGYSLENMSKHRDQLDQIVSVITIVISAVAAISLIVAGLGIMTIMLVSVKERTREIGIKKSVGASRAIIMKEFLMEAGALSLVGGIAGAIGGILIALIGGAFLGIDVAIKDSIILFAIIFTVLIGILFGVYPSYKASKLIPVDALRLE